MNKVLVIRVGTLNDDIDDFIAAWKLTEQGRVVNPSFGLTFESMTGFLEVLTPTRVTLLHRLKQHGPMTINALAQLLNRDCKNVDTDVKALEELNIVGRSEDKLIEVPWDEIETRWKFAA